MSEWLRTEQDGGALWVANSSDKLRASLDTVALGWNARPYVLVTGCDEAPDFTATLSAARVILPNTPVAILPGRVFNGSQSSRVALTTTDTALAAMWEAVARAEHNAR